MPKEKPPQNSPEPLNEAIVEHNLLVMNGQMLRFLATESMGGSAGTVELYGKRYNCFGANGFADRETGTISVFGNPEDLPEDVTEGKVMFALRVALGFKPDTTIEFYRVVEFLDSDKFSDEGRRNIEEAIRGFNASWEEGRQL